MNPALDWNFPYTSQRMPVLAENMVCTAQPLASLAGVQVLKQGGNAVDAAIAAAITLAVVEPCMNGIGGDSFALVWDGSRLHGLNASGRSPRDWTREHFSRYSAMPPRGWDSVTVPGAVSGWRALSDRFGALPFGDLFESAIRYARDGYIVSPIVSRQWQGQIGDILETPGFREAFAPAGRAPRPGERFICPGQAATLEKIAASGGEAFYRGELARAIAQHARATGGLMDEEDLAAHQADWVEPVSMRYRDVELHEIGPNGQGIAALMALGIMDSIGLPLPQLDSTEFFHQQIEAMKLAFADVHRYVGDPKAMTVSDSELLDRSYLKARAPARSARRPLSRTRQAAHGRNDLPDHGGQRRPDGVADSVQLQGLRLGHRHPQHRHCHAQPRLGFQPDPRPRQRSGAAQAALPHHHPGISHKAEGPFSPSPHGRGPG